MGVQVSATVRQIGKSTSEATARNHACLIDRPEAKGGANRGPMGGELMLMGIGGCFMSNLLAAALERGLDLSGASVDVGATLETSPPRFTNIALRVHGGNADPAALREMIATAEAGCIAINTARGATEVTVLPA
ncbi:OsmC family protein [Sulfurisoma sediminicola]|uniref:Putative redox protein n=1 Tax=Sulfurisoma sediminicola TaxID=1381557 RepID=A0A497XGR1_9PROT|nr:OsmC family protein [Sulfurisoma sediminicola]RLJ65187.1 putative redox protein [Sulfurisoma sediminicola]